MFDAAVQTIKTSSIKHENKINKFYFLIECVMAFKFYQTRPNTIKQHQTRWPNGKILVTKECLVVFGRQTFPLCSGLKCNYDGIYHWPCKKLEDNLSSMAMMLQQKYKNKNKNKTKVKEKLAKTVTLLLVLKLPKHIKH